MHVAVNEMRAYEGDSERTLQHSLADTGRRNGCGNKREKEARHLWVRKMLITRQRHARYLVVQYSLRGDVVKRGIIVYEEVQMSDECDVGRIIVPSKQKRSRTRYCMELVWNLTKRRVIRKRVGRCMPGSSPGDASRVYVFTPLPPLLAPLITVRIRLRGSQFLRP
jgi:hypothetical protein